MNKCIFAGRIAEDLELKTTSSGVETVTFSLAVNRDYVKPGEDRKADFIRCVAWRKTATFICQYFRKGDGINLVSNVQTRSYDDKDGNKRYATEFIVDSVEFPLSKKSDGNQNYSNNTYSTPAVSAPVQTNDISQLADDGDLPF